MSTNSAPWDRPLDQWKVIELKDELKRRKLITRGLKEELVRRLHEALRKEAAEATDMGNGFNLQDEPLVTSKDVEVKDDGHAKPKDGGEPLVKNVNNENVHMVDVNDPCASVVAQDDRVGNLNDNKWLGSDDKRADETAGLTDCGLGADEDPASEITNPSVDAKIEASIPEDVKPIDSTAISQVSENMPDCTGFSAAERKDEAPITEESQIASEPIPQVSESVHQVVKCESVSTDSVSIKQENTLKDNLITDNVSVEPEVVKKEVPQPLSNAGDHGASVTDVEGGVESAAKCGDITHDMDVDSFGKGDADIYAHESVVEEPVQEKVSESKSSDITLDDDGGDKDFKIQESIAIDEKMESETRTVQINMEEKYEFVESIENSTQLAEKRKAGTDVEVEHEPPKRQRKWNSDHELAKVSAARPPRLDKENLPDATQTSPLAASNANLLSPIDKAQGVKLARTDSNIDSEAPKGRVVPPPQRSPTASLRIDKFLRPFTLKAVQELLAKTGTVRCFWMDHIKTHCYVTYSSVDEAIATRDAVYNLQWPPNGGRLLTAEFVEPEDVKLRVEGGPQSPPAVSQPTVPPPQSNQVNPHASVKPPVPPVVPPSSKQQLPPPPPLTPQARPQHVGRERLPPPPPPKKIEAPVLTLDDLFKKTRTTPRIYYLPLSEEQVAAKLASTGGDGRDKAADSRL
ncbi:Apoptotic chromatin condensation inducer in the nucleus [Nymphaea thermarum]|nr:Apoptotic chromatin condensation inducer in the nucleus [Nymphaea thermarum]